MSVAIKRSEFDKIVKAAQDAAEIPEEERFTLTYVQVPVPVKKKGHGMMYVMEVVVPE